MFYSNTPPALLDADMVSFKLSTAYVLGMPMFLHIFRVVSKFVYLGSVGVGGGAQVVDLTQQTLGAFPDVFQ